LVVQLVAFWFAFRSVPADSFSEGTGFFITTALHLSITAVPLMAFTVGIQMIIASLTRSFKEAQTWLGLLPIGPAIPGLAMVFLPVGGKLWMMLVPVLSQVVLMGEIVRGSPVSLGFELTAAATTLVAAAGLLAIAGKLYERDEIIFGGL
jgi:sodium transport system permease protein